ncbi:trehalose-6-phosphate synthase [Mitsuaria sp. WAJ17]|uniref:alpha,alpha-trehalose-phosphate synthase (UDP-forming) n=1 Tax=Mitsuaria sp. WAJ17 TaxID=2761452 RepID=UPI00160233CB|nr:trehalose-6-phosphate synthase [Mitsuaria sp. WAJ17]MBB2484186.1 trehalose-6-phosphate synthase [Mitsuaria sp. WAJ17]
MKTLRLQLRFLLPLALALVGAAYIALPLLDQVTLRWFSRDLNSRGALMVNAMSDAVAQAMLDPRGERLASLLDRAVQDERLFAIAACDASGVLLHATRAFPDGLICARVLSIANRQDPRLKLAGGPVHVGVHNITSLLQDVPAEPWIGAASAPITFDAPSSAPAAGGAVASGLGSELVGRLVLLHDMSFIEKRSQDTRRYLVGFIASLGFVIALITVSVAQLSWRGWVKGARAIMRGEGLVSPLLPPPELAPFMDELRNSLRDLEDEYRRMQGAPLEWTGERLRNLLQTQLRGDQVIVVSNREPYIHEQGPEGVVVRRPASGLVTAVEPVMRACSGTWIAHGSGSADREAVDRHDRVGVPPGVEDYQLRRIWLSPEEEQGYYYGFANEGLWPLCHVAHVRPVFRESDWAAYQQVNQRFADAVVAEARSEDPVVLVQDYHFALLPAMIRAQLPQATVLTFWHIPWPNPESFGICPWHKEILQGLLGSTILGFHTRFHCRNFMETVDRSLEARIEAEYATIRFQDKETLVESYPISIEWPEPATVASWPSVADCRQQVVDRLGLPQDLCLAVGVDRFDYTKGILERLNAVERLLEKAPAWIGRFVFVQVAAPTRSSLDEYRSFQDHVQRVAERINRRFGQPGYRPVHLLAQHHGPDAVNELFRAADICVVTSLHDGMNLVCKEFVAARDDQQGVLVLSRFAGAAREMTEALIVNPYHVEETADALLQAATMPPAEQRERMASLRSTVREFNVFRWAARMLADAGRWRLRARVEARVRRLGSG